MLRSSVNRKLIPGINITRFEPCGKSVFRIEFPCSSVIVHIEENGRLGSTAV